MVSPLILLLTHPTLFCKTLLFLFSDAPHSILSRNCVRDSSEKPTARYERGLVAQVKKSNIHLLLMKLANKVLPDP